MSEKTYVFGSDANVGSNSLLASILPALQNRGIDSSYLMGLMSGGNGNGGFFGNNGGFQDIIALIVIAAIFGNGNGNGLFGGGNNNAEREMLMSAIQRNGTDLSQLAQSLNCSIGQIDNAIGQVATQICNLTGQVGLSSERIINSVLSGNASLASQICNCCCDLKQLISESNYLTERGFCNTNQILSQGFSSVAYETQRQTCDLQNAIKDSTAQILAGQAAIEKRELQREIDSLREQKETYKLGNMITAATAPILQEVEGIKCKLPKTEVITAQPEYVAVNRSINVGYTPTGYCGAGFGFGNWGGWNGWNNGCCNGNAFAWG